MKFHKTDDGLVVSVLENLMNLVKYNMKSEGIYERDETCMESSFMVVKYNILVLYRFYNLLFDGII